MTPPPSNPLADKRSYSNGHSSPARTASAGKPASSTTDKKLQINGHPSPLHLPTSINNNHAGKPHAEIHMKTDDRMRLAKERREERERSLAAREQLIREKERRARLQYERTVEERWRRLEEQRQKEELRRAAVEEKRRQQLEEEKERLEALMKRSLERSLQLEQRTKRWSRGCPPGAAPCSPHRSPYRSTLNASDHNRAGVQGGSQSTPNTPKKERLRRDRRTASPGFGSPVRRAESPAIASKHLASPATILTSKMHTQSPSGVRQEHSSPVRHRPNLPSDGHKKVEDKKSDRNCEESTTEVSVKKKSITDSPASASQVEKKTDKDVVPSDKSKAPKTDTIDKSVKNETADKTDSSDKKDTTESSPLTPTTKPSTGTTNAEEASRMLAERRRQARVQKELEEQKRCEQEEEERLKAEQLKMQLAQNHPAKEEKKTPQVSEERKKEQDIDSWREDDEKRQREGQEKEPQNKIDREREKTKVLPQEDAERQRQGREMQKIQEEEERQIRKKRIEEIMKRTRKGEVDLKEGQVETKCVSPPGEIRINVQTSDEMKDEATRKVEFQVNERVNVQDAALVKKEEAMTQVADQKSLQVKKSIAKVATPKSVVEKGPDTKQVSEQQGTQVNKDGTAQVFKQQERKLETPVNKQNIVQTNVKATDQMNKDLTKTADSKVTKKEGVVVNGEMKNQGNGMVSSHCTTEVTKQQQKLQVEESPAVSTVDGKIKKGSETQVTRPSVTPLPVMTPPPPLIKLEPLDVKGNNSCDEVQSMEVSPASKEELISIPEFSPVNEVHQNSMSNTRALEDLLDLTGNVSCPKLSTESNVGDCNKNLIEGVVSPISDPKLIQLSSASPNKLSIH
ncbi:MAP7 domain-containing protein 2a [Lampris incognitus]|uniref:MAP7 domain-containing protein 2a n=1 Tax=Lampris incognitus TaxID=2546036 RepID=UPI0024B51DAD|nr:MAP7 domain-containing protein 2a [Lampris incognitus]